MANYYSCSRTNYFRVTNEEKYKALFDNLVGGEDEVHDFSREEDGVTYHAFGTYGSVDYIVPPNNSDDSNNTDDYDYDYNFDLFLEELQKILPDDEAFICMESGHENLRYITGLLVIVTNTKIEYMDIRGEALRRAREILNNPAFDSKLEY